MKVRERAALSVALGALLFAAGVPLAAQYQGISFGLGGEVNAVSLQEDRGYGAVVTVESRLNRYFALAFLGNASLQNNSTLNDLSEGTAFIGLEAAMFLRFYFLSPAFMRPGGVEMFLGAGGGVMAVMNGQDVRETRGHPEAAGVFGVRFRLGSRLYLEPYVRGGFPFIGGAGLTVGFRFPSRYERTAADEAERAKTASPLNGTFVFIFAANLALFDTLDEAVILQNRETLSTVLQLLEENPSARLLIEGYANPVLGTGQEERETLRPLSRRRADYIANLLTARGVSPDSAPVLRLVPQRLPDSAPVLRLVTQRLPDSAPVLRLVPQRLPDSAPVLRLVPQRLPDSAPVLRLVTQRLPDSAPVLRLVPQRLPDSAPVLRLVTQRLPDSAPVLRLVPQRLPDSAPVLRLVPQRLPDSAPVLRLVTQRLPDSAPVLRLVTQRLPDSAPVLRLVTQRLPDSATPIKAFSTWLIDHFLLPADSENPSCAGKTPDYASEISNYTSVI